MLNIILNIIGIIVIFYALALIKKDRERIKDLEEEENFKVDDFLREVDNFSNVLDRKTEDLEKTPVEKDDIGVYYEPSTFSKTLNKPELNEKTIEEVGYGGIIKDVTTNKKNVTSSNEKILELKELGYNKEEIAKKTGRSIREIEVILKMYI